MLSDFVGVYHYFVAFFEDDVVNVLSQLVLLYDALFYIQECEIGFYVQSVPLKCAPRTALEDNKDFFIVVTGFRVDLVLTKAFHFVLKNYIDYKNASNSY